MTLPPHGPPEITEAQQAATSLGEVEDPTPDNVSRALQDYSPYAVAAAAASLGASGGGGGGGGSQAFQPPVDGSVTVVEMSDETPAMTFDETVGFDMQGWSIFNTAIDPPVALATVLSSGGNNAGGASITNLADPSDPQDAATKAYVTANAVATGTKTLTSADLLAIDTTPVQIVAAPGAGKVIVPYAGWWWQIPGTAYTGTWTPTVGINYDGASFLGFLGTAVDNGPLADVLFGSMQQFSPSHVDYALANKPLVFANDGNALTGGTGTLKVTVLYAVLTL